MLLLYNRYGKYAKYVTKYTHKLSLTLSFAYSYYICCTCIASAYYFRAVISLASKMKKGVV